MKKTLNTTTPDGMYMDIESIEFNYDLKKLQEQIKACDKILEENPFLSSVSISMVANEAIGTSAHFNSTVDDDEKSEDTEFRIDTEILSVGRFGSLWYRGYSKYTSDFCEVELSPLLDPELYSVEYQWKDSGTTSNALFCANDGVHERDDEIFFYGISYSKAESLIGQDFGEDFIILSVTA